MIPSIRVPLFRGAAFVAWTTIDIGDYDSVARFRWGLDSHGYAYRRAHRDGRYCTVRLHRELLGLPQGDRQSDVDHINREKLDNRRANLRICSKREINAQNRGSTAGSTSPFRGVYWDRERGRWRAMCTISGQKISVGWFDNEIDAATSVDAYRLRHMPGARPDAALVQALADREAA